MGVVEWQKVGVVKWQKVSVVEWQEVGAEASCKYSDVANAWCYRNVGVKAGDLY